MMRSLNVLALTFEDLVKILTVHHRRRDTYSFPCSEKAFFHMIKALCICA